MTSYSTGLVRRAVYPTTAHTRAILICIFGNKSYPFSPLIIYLDSFVRQPFQGWAHLLKNGTSQKELSDTLFTFVDDVMF